MSEITAEALLEKLLKGKIIHDKFAKDMREKFLINGRTIDTWETRFKITINTDNLTPPICRQFDLLLLELNQEAAFYHAVASMKLQMLKRGHDSAFRDKYFALVQEYEAKMSGKGKLPAAATLENLAKVETDNVESAQSVAEVEEQFWSDIMDHLTTCRKIIENATLNNNVEAKLLNR